MSSRSRPRIIQIIPAPPGAIIRYTDGDDHWTEPILALALMRAEESEEGWVTPVDLEGYPLARGSGSIIEIPRADLGCVTSESNQPESGDRTP